MATGVLAWAAGMLGSGELEQLARNPRTRRLGTTSLAPQRTAIGCSIF
jgi:hypothetical protein